MFWVLALRQSELEKIKAYAEGLITVTFGFLHWVYNS